METIQELYQEIIIDHSNCPRNEGEIEYPTHIAEGYNATCGDEMTVSLLVRDGIIEDIKFRAQGCSISRASGSMLTEKIRGMPLAGALKFSKDLQKMLTSDFWEMHDEGEMGDLAALLGIRQFPMRIKCATLAWHTFENALKNGMRNGID
ncbi:MAG: SUF system NifU family Fe-S cluster assembly protein [Puniceicoccales bacterium]|jgi:nitrogen fixation NifU-like protein|nr:SUF system NifU family Fe-S cluster assembly protein [Puniceicoccales bacterium]